MNKNVKGALVVGGVAIVGYLIYYYFFSYNAEKKYLYKHFEKYCDDTDAFVKRECMKTRIKNIDSYDKGYVRAWINALKNGYKFFIFNGKKYDSQLGSAI
jgi:hypothetical protein